MQERRSSSALAMELCLLCINPSISRCPISTTSFPILFTQLFLLTLSPCISVQAASSWLMWGQAEQTYSRLMGDEGQMTDIWYTLYTHKWYPQKALPAQEDRTANNAVGLVDVMQYVSYLTWLVRHHSVTVESAWCSLMASASTSGTMGE